MRSLCPPNLIRGAVLALVGVGFLSSCSRSKSFSDERHESDSTEKEVAVEACGLLTSAEIERVLGEPVRDATGGSQPQAGMAVTQCYFQLPTTNKSVSLTVWQHVKGVRREPEEFWDERFHERGEGKAGEAESEGREITPQPIAHLGDEAFWSGTGIGGALYVRKGNRFFRLGIGGADDQETRINKTRALAELILPRF